MESTVTIGLDKKEVNENVMNIRDLRKGGHQGMSQNERKGCHGGNARVGFNAQHDRSPLFTV